MKKSSRKQHVSKAEWLKDVSQRKPIPKNRVDPVIENAVCELALENPAMGQVRASNELRKAAGRFAFQLSDFDAKFRHRLPTEPE